METIAIGLNHKIAPVELREKLAFSKARLPEAYSALRDLFSIQEGLILSTCNRVEVYGVTDDPERGILELKHFLSKYHKLNLKEFEQELYAYQGRDAIYHLFNVASGLDSMVIGETQILGQLKAAYSDGHRNKSVGKALEALLQKSFFVAKEVRTSTNITKGAVSVGSVAVKLAEERLGGLSGRKAVVIGAGKASELVIKYLKSKQASSVVVGNRTYEKAQKLAQKFDSEAINFARLSERLVDADILISSTSAPHFIIRKEDIAKVMRKRRGRPLLIIDLAVPRDIEPEVALLESVYIYDIDSLEKVVEKNVYLRNKEIDICDQIIQKRMNEFMSRSDQQKRIDGNSNDLYIQSCVFVA